MFNIVTCSSAIIAKRNSTNLRPQSKAHRIFGSYELQNAITRFTSNIFRTTKLWKECLNTRHSCWYICVRRWTWGKLKDSAFGVIFYTCGSCIGRFREQVAILYENVRSETYGKFLIFFFNFLVCLTKVHLKFLKVSTQRERVMFLKLAYYAKSKQWVSSM